MIDEIRLECFIKNLGRLLLLQDGTQEDYDFLIRNIEKIDPDNFLINLEKARNFQRSLQFK